MLTHRKVVTWGPFLLKQKKKRIGAFNVKAGQGGLTLKAKSSINMFSVRKSQLLGFSNIF